MSLKIAVQMDPIERINIRGDSTFALLLEAQRRKHTIAYYTPDRLALTGNKLVAAVQPLSVLDKEGEHFALGAATTDRSQHASTSSCCARTRRSTSPTSPPRICSSASIPRRWW